MSYLQLIFISSGVIVVALFIFDRINILNSRKNWFGNNQLTRSELTYIANYLKDRQTCTAFLNSFDFSDEAQTTTFFNKVSSYSFAKVKGSLPSPLENFNGTIPFSFISTSSAGYSVTTEVNLIAEFNASGSLISCFSNPSTDPNFTALRKIFCEDLGAIFTTECSFAGLPLKYETKGSCPEKSGFVIYESTGEFQHCNLGPNWSGL